MITDHWGQGLSGARSSGGGGSSSNWWTEAQPSRWTLPRQSAPVSPPPRMITRLPRAEIVSASPMSSPATRRFCWGRYSIAKWTPSSSRPGTGRSRGWPAPIVSTTASKRARSSAPVMSTPTS